ncbi:hypothetical protein FN846DRAFT_983593 [Sphaerosporella brunnea]|uniref:Uncharacterized protein n=1 Tax=Sphaerosporella brunnea TaxID=1250544 RepID=A0A5J5F9B6_9PEZI|nr:hypothetical protein FN846DRAFT_983593 [Sphaerosporella brunnea]
MERILDAEITMASIIDEIDCLLPQDCVAALQDRSSSVRGKAIDMLCVYQGFVSGWCRRFCADRLPFEASSPASPSERLRIQRAFYRFWALSRAIRASGIKTPTDSDDLSYNHQKVDVLCSSYRSQVYHKEIRKCVANRYTVSCLTLLDLPVLYALLFTPETGFCTLESYVWRVSGWGGRWTTLFDADRTNRSNDSTAFPPRCICTRRDMPSDEYDGYLRVTADSVAIVPEELLVEDEVRDDLALWDDSRLELQGLFLPVV